MEKFLSPQTRILKRYADVMSGVVQWKMELLKLLQRATPRRTLKHDAYLKTGMISPTYLPYFSATYT